MQVTKKAKIKSSCWKVLSCQDLLRLIVSWQSNDVVDFIRYQKTHLLRYRNPDTLNFGKARDSWRYIAEKNDIAAARFLIQHRCFGMTFEHQIIAIRKDHIDLMKFLFSSENIAYFDDGISLTHTCAREGRLEMLKFFISIGHPVTSSTLDDAVKERQLHIVQYLIRALNTWSANALSLTFTQDKRLVKGSTGYKIAILLLCESEPVHGSFSSIPSIFPHFVNEHWTLIDIHLIHKNSLWESLIMCWTKQDIIEFENRLRQANLQFPETFLLKYCTYPRMDLTWFFQTFPQHLSSQTVFPNAWTCKNIGRKISVCSASLLVVQYNPKFTPADIIFAYMNDTAFVPTMELLGMSSVHFPEHEWHKEFLTQVFLAGPSIQKIISSKWPLLIKF